MKTWLVGGAVRDKLLGIESTEKDWVVVGARAQDMLAAGFRQVGKDFPVFLHPETREEYALARTERKSGKGYYGFTVNADPTVTLEEDLYRRDLTINAMAMDDKGTLVDPWGGQADLEAKILRHVSPAFVEDPLRVLRLARFAARLYPLGFKIAEETAVLLRQMVRSGELENLVPERVWQEFQRSLSEPRPDQFIQTLRNCGALAIVFPEINALFGVPNPPHHHPEIDSGIHTLMVLNAACKLSTDPKLRFAALLHDLGKAKTPMAEWPRHIQHEKRGLAEVRKLCKRLRTPVPYRDLALLVCEHHLTVHRYADMKPSTRVKVLERLDAFRRPDRFHLILLACQADALGTGKENPSYPQTRQWQYLLAECEKIQAKTLLEQGFKDLQLKEELFRRRVACADLIQNMQGPEGK